MVDLFFKNLHSVSHYGSSNLHFHQQCTSSLFSNSQGLETTQVSIKGCVDKEDVLAFLSHSSHQVSQDGHLQVYPEAMEEEIVQCNFISGCTGGNPANSLHSTGSSAPLGQ